MKPIARLFSVLAVFGMLIPLLVACGAAPAAPGAPAAATGATAAPASGAPAPAPAGSVSNGVITMGCGQAATYLRNFNPFRATPPLFPTLYGIYEPLMVNNPAQGEILPWLATEYAWSDDNTALTFTLREGVQWSDGEPFTAEDVVYTFDLLKNTSGLSGPGLAAVAGANPYIESVSATDDATVVFTFSRPFAPGLIDIIYQNIVPEHIWKDVADPVAFANENPVGTGPFTEVSSFQPQVYQIDRNPNYWHADELQIEGIRCPAYAANDQMNLMLVNDELDWAAGGFPNIDTVFVAKDPANRGYWFAAAGGVVSLLLNTTRPPFDDPNVRKAISMAINRQQITTVAVFNYVQPADVTGLSGAFPDLKVADPSALADWTTFNVEQANALLDAAGLAKGPDGIRTLPDGTKMDYGINVAGGFAIHVAAAGMIVQHLKAVGINATLAQTDAAGWTDRLQKGDFDMSMGITGFTGPVDFYSAYRSQMSAAATAPVGEIAAGGNYARFSSEQADALLDQFAAATEEGERKEIAAQLQQLFADEAPNLPLYPSPLWYEYNSARFTGFPTEEDPYTLGSFGQILSPHQLLVWMALEPR